MKFQYNFRFVYPSLIVAALMVLVAALDSRYPSTLRGSITLIWPLAILVVVMYVAPKVLRFDIKNSFSQWIYFILCVFFGSFLYFPLIKWMYLSPFYYGTWSSLDILIPIIILIMTLWIFFRTRWEKQA